MHRAHRCTLAGIAWARPAPTEPRPCAAARHAAPLPASLGLRFRALLGLGFVPPPEPRPCAHCASIAYALLPAARVPLCRHRADPESSSRSLPSGSSARIAPTAPTARRRPRPPLALRRPRGPGWQESHRMHPFFAECAKKAPFLATSARNACFSRSEWQHPRPMHPFPGAIGRFGIHGARILPPRALFRVEEPEITHGAKMLPAPPGLSAAAACGPAERALRPAVRTRPACRMRPLPSRLCPPRPAPPAISPAFIAAVLHASRFTTRIAPTARRHLPRRPIRSGVSRRPGASCRPISDRRIPPAARCPRTLMSICRGPRPTPAPTDARSLAPPGPNPRQPDPSPAPAGPRPPVEPSVPIRAPPPAAPHPAARVPLRFR